MLAKYTHPPKPSDSGRDNYGPTKEGKPFAQTRGLTEQAPKTTQVLSQAIPPERRWNLAFIGILSYMFLEYTRLPQMYPVFQHFPLAKALIVLTVVGLLATPRSQGNRQSGSPGIDLAILAFLGACFVSALFARDTSIALQGFLDMIRWVAVYFLISRILTSSWRLRIFVFLLLLLCLKLSQFEIRDYLSQQAFGRSGEFLSAHGVGAGSTDFFGNGGDFGVAMCVMWPLAGALLFGETKKLSRLFLLACFLSFLISIFLCGSRGAVLGAAAVAFATWAKNPKRIVGVVMVLALALGSFYVLPEATRNRMRSVFSGPRDETAQMRINLWQAGMSMFAENPILGIGLKNFGLAYWADYNGRTSTPTVFVQHSIYVQALSETGLAGGVPLLVMWFLFLRVNARTRRHLKALGLANRHNFEYRLSIGLDLAFVGYMVSGAFLTVLFYPHLWYLLGLNVALHSACIRKQPDMVPAESEKRERNFALAPC
jgi:O-antigen ligase